MRKLSPTLMVCLGGLVATACDVAALALLVECGTPIAVAAFIGASIGAGVGFCNNKYLAFRDRSPLAFRQVGTFGLVAVGTALMMAVSMQVVAVGMGVPYLIAKAFCATAAFFLWSLPAQKRFVFPRRAPSSVMPSMGGVDSASSLA